MIQIQPFAFPSDSSSPLAGTSALQGVGTKAFAAFVGDGMAREPSLPGAVKTPTQAGAFATQQSASQALTQISGTAPTAIPQTGQGQTRQPQLPDAVIDFAAANNTSLDAASPKPLDMLPEQTAPAEMRGDVELRTTEVPRAMHPTEAIVAATPAKMQTGPATKHTKIAKADAPNAERPTSDELIAELSAEPLPGTGDLLQPTTADEKPDAPEEPKADQPSQDADAQTGHTEVFARQAVALAAMPERQAAGGNVTPDEPSSAEAVSADTRSSAPSRADDHRATKPFEPMPTGRHSASEQAALAQTLADSSAARIDGNVGSVATGPSESGLRPVAGTITAEAKTPVAHPSMPDTISGRPGEIGRQLGIEIARHTAEGRDNLTIRLDPAELGRIHIRMHFDDAGQLRAQVSAESGAALDMLRRDSNDLSRALNDAGVRTDAQSFQFEGRGQQREQPAPRNQPDFARSAPDSAGDNDPVIETARRKLNPNGALDLFA